MGPLCGPTNNTKYTVVSVAAPTTQSGCVGLVGSGASVVQVFVVTRAAATARP